MNNLIVSIGCDSSIKILEERGYICNGFNYEATATTMKLEYDDKEEYIIHIHEKILKGSFEWKCGIAAHEAYHYCLWNYPTDDEEFFAYRIEEVVEKIIHEILKA